MLFRGEINFFLALWFIISFGLAIVQEEISLLSLKCFFFHYYLQYEWQVENENDSNEVDDWDYIEEGPAEIIWQGNEIIVKKKRIKVPKRNTEQQSRKEVRNMNLELWLDIYFPMGHLTVCLLFWFYQKV